MSNRIKNNLKNLVGQTLNQYYSKVKPTISDLRYKQEYQNRIIECMVGEVDDNYITTPETDNPIVKLEHSKEGLVKVPTVKGKTILVDADGNETDTPAEGCKLLSVGEEEDNKLIILSKNKNLFDNSERVNGYYWSADNTETKHNTSYLSRTYIKVNQETYVTNGNTQVLEYDKDKNFIQRVQVTNHAYTPTENVGYVRLSYYNHGIDFKGQFELGNISTTYVEPKHHKTEILLKEPLRSIPNGAQDEIVGNKIIRRVGSIILDGNKRVHVWNDSTGDTVNGYQYFHYYKEDNNIKDYCKIYNNILPSNKGGHIAKQEGFVYTNYIGFSIHKDRLGVEDVNDYLNNQEKVSQWFKDNHIEFLYELKEPIIEELPNGITLQGFDDTAMYIENIITPTVQYGYNALIPYKQELSQQKEEVEINTLDIENNIIPYLMDMEFNLMLMEDNE